MSDITGKWFLYNGEDFAVGNFEPGTYNPEGHRTIYEVIRVEEGVPLFIEDYLDRLENSFRLDQTEIGWTREEILGTIRKLIQINNHKSGPVKLIFGCDKPPFLLAYLMKPHLPKPEEYITGVKTILMKETRINPNAKVWNNELRERSMALAEKENAYEVILLNKDGYITEGSRSNIFFITDEKVVTTPDDLILPGITRKKVLEIMDKAGIDLSFKAVKPEELNQYEACFLTGTTRKVVPVRRIDGHEFSASNESLHYLTAQFDKYVGDYNRQARIKSK